MIIPMIFPMDFPDGFLGEIHPDFYRTSTGDVLQVVRIHGGDFAGGDAR